MDKHNFFLIFVYNLQTKMASQKLTLKVEFIALTLLAKPSFYWLSLLHFAAITTGKTKIKNKNLSFLLHAHGVM